jgi:oligopeptide transport system substrate-binding protein
MFLKAVGQVNKQFCFPPSLPRSLAFICFCLCLLFLAACGDSAASATVSPTTKPAVKQLLVFPNVGVQDLDSLDPTQGGDQNTDQALTMIYSGLVRLDQNLNVLPDQASWAVSTDRKVYTFYLKSGITFSDGTPVTAQTYVYALTRALLPATSGNNVLLFLGNIVGAANVNAGKTTTLSGVRAVNALTLEITLTKPTDYFLQALANPIAFPVNQQVVLRYGEDNWSEDAAGSGVGTGPFMVKTWQHNTKIVLVPNPDYYSTHTRLTEVDMIFVADAHTAFQAYQGGQYGLDWNILPADLAAAHSLAGFASQSLLETDTLFFNTQMPPFNQLALRQAFAYATDRTTLVQSTLSNGVVAAPTIVPPGMPGYQPVPTGLAFSHAKAQAALQSIYPDITQAPVITFSYPSSLVSSALATALQQMWQTTLGLQINLLPVETNAYNIEVSKQQVQFGFEQWNADFADPYDLLAVNLLSTSPDNEGKWTNAQFDQLVQQAEQTSGAARLDLYAQAEQIAINDVGWLPLDHQIMAAVVPPTVHGVSLNHMGLYFGDWSNVYIVPR